MYETADATPTTNTKNYTYIETETDSTCTYSVDSITYITYIIEYDKEGRQTSQTIQMNGTETSRTVATYDSAGNAISQVSYSSGVKNMEMKCTYKAVKVSRQTADRVPQFNRGK